MRRIGEVKGLGPELKLDPFSYREVAEQAEIQVDGAGSTESVTPHSAESGLGDAGKGGLVIELIEAADLFNDGLYLVLRLVYARSDYGPVASAQGVLK